MNDSYIFNSESVTFSWGTVIFLITVIICFQFGYDFLTLVPGSILSAMATLISGNKSKKRRRRRELKYGTK